MKKGAENQDDKKYVYMDTEKTCPNHRKIHDGVTLSSIKPDREKKIKERIENPDLKLLTDVNIKLWKEKIIHTIYSSVIEHMIYERWDLAIKGLRLIRDTEALIPRPTEAAVHLAKDRTSEASSL